MPYADFTPDVVESSLNLRSEREGLFPDIEPIPVPGWLPETMRRGRSITSLNSEKARSEILVVPILLAAIEPVQDEITLFSGQRLDVDPARGLTGECDFILSRKSALPRLRAPLLTIVEAKRGDLELGLGQCIAQMVGARLFNEKAGEPPRPIFGCVTTGDTWQFLKLDGDLLRLDPTIRFSDNVGTLLAIFRSILGGN